MTPELNEPDWVREFVNETRISIGDLRRRIKEMDYRIKELYDWVETIDGSKVETEGDENDVVC